MRKFYLENEIGERIALQGSNLFFNDPEGLGCSYGKNYESLGNGHYIEVESEYEQPSIVGDLVFLRNHYTEYQTFMNWVHKKYALKIVYRPLSVEYFMDVKFQKIGKSEIKNGLLACPVVFDGLTMWYKRGHVEFAFTATVDESKKYPYTYPYRYALSAIAGSIDIEVTGHAPAEIYLEGDGALEAPIFTLTDKYTGEIYGKLDLSAVTFSTGEKLIYSALSNELDGNPQCGIWKEVNGVRTDLTPYIDVSYKNFFAIPIDTPCELGLSVSSAFESTVKIEIFQFYGSV